MQRAQKNNTIHLVSLLVLLLCFSISKAQTKGPNLIPNPSFENHKNKSKDIKNAFPWKGIGTVDYYLKAEKQDTSKYRGAHKGTCFVGLRFQEAYKEYMYVQLNEAMEPNRTYHFRMFIRLLFESTVTVRQLGVYFSDDAFKFGMKFDERGLIDTTYKKGISGAMNWIPIQGDYHAHGGEKYIIIGNFNPVTKEDFIKRNKWDLFGFKEAYYFIDDVSLRKIISPNDSLLGLKPVKKKKVKTLPDTLKIGETIVLKNIQFENNQAILKVSSEIALEELVNKLNNNPFMEIQINGYTDNNGKESANKTLSKERAKAVYEYLKKEGVLNIMTYKGFGAQKPIAPNDTEENRALNRRVEIEILKMEMD